MTAPLVDGVPSPCINICRMDQASGLCEGCLRSLDEIASWGSLDDAGKRAVVAQLASRQQRWRQLRRQTRTDEAPSS